MRFRCNGKGVWNTEIAIVDYIEYSLARFESGRHGKRCDGTIADRLIRIERDEHLLVLLIDPKDRSGRLNPSLELLRFTSVNGLYLIGFRILKHDHRDLAGRKRFRIRIELNPASIGV